MEIKTERLIVRPLEMADLDALVVLQADPEMLRFIGPFHRDALARWVRENIDEWAARGCGRMAIVERESGALVGRTGVRLVPQFGEFELAWALAAEVRGRGYATEAAGACLDWFLREHRPQHVTALIAPDNFPSIAVAGRLGMEAVRKDVMDGEPLVVYVASGPNAGDGG